MKSQINKGTAAKLLKAVAAGEIDLANFPEFDKEPVDFSKLSVDELIQLKALMEKCWVKKNNMQK